MSNELRRRPATNNGSTHASEVVVESDDISEVEGQKNCGSRCDDCSSITMALLVRLIFALHSCIAVWRVVSIYDIRYFALMATMGLWLTELLLTLIKRRGKEWPYFSPCLLAYLICCIPAIWLIEIRRTDTTRAGRELSTNTTLYGLDDLVIPLGDFEWAIALEQSLLCLLIIGKWLLPRGGVSKDQLSQVLLVYLGLAADMVDLFELLGEEAIYNNETMVYALLAIWTWSMIQFSLALATTRGSSLHFDEDEEEEERLKEIARQENRCKACLADLEIWAIIVTMLMQDGPYFVYRVCAIVIYKVDSYTNYFFTAKNFLFLVLQTYRLCVIICPCCTEMQNYDNDAVPLGLGVATAMNFQKNDEYGTAGSRAPSRISMVGFNVSRSNTPPPSESRKETAGERRQAAMQKMLAFSRKT